MQIDELLRLAWQVRDQAYAPYSKFSVGAALLSDAGEAFTGCNVENVSFGLTVCAERSAVSQAVANGVRRFKTIAIVSDSDLPVSPCGACRQVLAEFAPHLMIVCENRTGQRFTASLKDLLPRAKEGILG
jgi:cytidine deaminase